jgi:hypothetical protein
MMGEDPATIDAIRGGREERIRDCMAIWASGILEGWIESGEEKIWDFEYFESADPELSFD